MLPALRSTAMRTALPRFPRQSVVRWQSSAAAGHGEYTSILVSQPAPGVSQITLNRPKALNALNSTLFHELNAALRTLSTDDSTGCVVLTGSDKAFAAGADIKEMKDKQFAEVYKGDFLAHWTELSGFRKPIVAAVSGYALGGGCELAMMCDIILAAPNAVFGQPEINLGVIPGAGGTQRLTHALGKSRAMEIVLTGKNFSAAEAAEWGLVSRVVSEGGVVDEAVKVAGKIASKGMLAVQAAKEGVNAAYEMSLTNGLHFERRLFHQLFATNDQKVGMNAFANKEKAKWTNS
ncbi:putative enoyl-CoA hydratase, mitochondrial [Rhodotorula toruloides]|nr:putative enoyl-CoA hydratase, mitochondrial [Rhodotorula toruloides]